jgi:guanylate kinase
VSRSEFERKVAGSEMVEFATVHNNFYGTPKAELQRIQA